jgi:NAD(P)-dependent dehydrogenase (short-subunit alcohol dehydrogenase family)
MKDLRNTYGQYAVVTGASSGIGEEFARQLAAAGVNVVVGDVHRPAGLLDRLPLPAPDPRRHRGLHRPL